MGRGYELIVTVASSPSAEVAGEKEEGSAEVRRIRWHRKNLFPLVRFSCVSTSTYLWRTGPSGREFNLRGDEPSLKASFFGVFLFPSLLSVFGLCTSSVLAACACNPRIPLPFLIDWSFSAVIGPYCNLEATQRFSQVEDSEPYMLSQHSCTLNWLDNLPHVLLIWNVVINIFILWTFQIHGIFK